MQIDEISIGDVISLLSDHGKQQDHEVIGVIKGFWWDNVCKGDRVVFLMTQTNPPYTFMSYADPQKCTMVSKKVATGNCTCPILTLMAGGCKCGHLTKPTP